MQPPSANNMRSRGSSFNNNNNNEFDMFFNTMQRMEDQHQHKLKDLRKQIIALKAQKVVTEVSWITIRFCRVSLGVVVPIEIAWVILRGRRQLEFNLTLSLSAKMSKLFVKNLICEWGCDLWSRDDCGSPPKSKIPLNRNLRTSNIGEVKQILLSTVPAAGSHPNGLSTWCFCCWWILFLIGCATFHSA